MKSKKKNIALPIILSLLAAAVVAVVVLSMRKGFKKYELTDDAKKFLQVYGQDGSRLFYATDAAQVKANPNEEKDIIYEEGTITTHDIMVPIKTIIWDDGQRKNFNEKAYIIKDTIIA